MFFYKYILQDSSSEEMERRIKNSFVKMSASFPDPLKAEECFHKLNQMKDSKIFIALEQLLDDRTIKSAQQTRVCSSLLFLLWCNWKKISITIQLMSCLIYYYRQLSFCIVVTCCKCFYWFAKTKDLSELGQFYSGCLEFFASSS